MDDVRRDKPLLSPEFLGLVDHAFFRCPFASIEDLIAASSSDTDGAGVAESEINVSEFNGQGPRASKGSRRSQKR